MEDINCNLCGSGNFKILYKTKKTFSSIEEYAPTSNSLGNFSRIVKCKNCGLIYLNPRENSENIINNYRKVVDTTCIEEERGRVFTFKRSLKEIEKFRNKGKVLDVGCNIGTFLERAKIEGWDVWGVEPNDWAAEYAKGRNLNIFNGTLREAEFPEEFFDVITMWDVLEHFTDPSQELRKINRLLKGDGLLFLTTMNIKSKFAKIMGKKYPWLMQQHLYYFSPETIKKIMIKNGFEIFKISTHKRIVRLAYLVGKIKSYNRYLSHFLNKAINTLKLGSMLITVDMGDLMTVHARKAPQ